MAELPHEADDTPERAEQESVDRKIETFLIAVGFSPAGSLVIPTLEQFETADDPDQLRDAYYDRLEAMRGDGTLSDTVLGACVNLGRAALQSRRGLHDLAEENIEDALLILENEAAALERRGQNQAQIKVLLTLRAELGF